MSVEPPAPTWMSDRELAVAILVELREIRRLLEKLKAAAEQKAK